MRYQVPQFIEVEDKIFGPLTLRQFIYLAGGAGLGFIIYKSFPAIVSIPIAIAIIAFAIALAFYRPDGHRPFIVIVEKALYFIFNPKLYVWKKVEKKPVANETKSEEIKAGDLFVPRLSESKLRDLTWSLDIHENLDRAAKK
jgi:hypothetical protein